MKKIITFLLAAVLLLSLAIPAGAAEFTDADQISMTNTEAVTVLSELGIIAGMGDGTFAPNATLTRAQAAKILAYITLGKDAANALKAEAATFTDVPVTHWSAPFVEHCAAAGIVAGLGNGKFGPDATLTGTAFGKMLLVAIGMNAEEKGLVGASWDKNTIALLKETGISTGYTVTSTNLSRQDACRLAHSALFHGEYHIEDSLAYTVFGVTRGHEKGAHLNFYRPVCVYTSNDPDMYWSGTDMTVNASPFYVATGITTGGEMYELMGSREFPTKDLIIYRNGAAFSTSSFTNNILKDDTATFDRTMPGLTMELYHDGSRDCYNIIMHAYRSDIVTAVDTAAGTVTLKNGLVINAKGFTEADIGTYCIYNGVGSGSWTSIAKGTEAFKGTVLKTTLTDAGDGSTCKLGDTTYAFNRFCAVKPETYIKNGGKVGDTVNALVNGGVLYAIW